MAVHPIEYQRKMNFISLDDKSKSNFFNVAGEKLGLPPQSIEKDWWVTQVLSEIFSLDYKDNIQFKGGTSLSKCWNLIQRFSEDIDLAINRDMLGFSGELSKNQISNNLRRASKTFIIDTLLPNIQSKLDKYNRPGKELSFSTNSNEKSTQDPVQIFINYPSIYNQEDYIAHTIQLEITGRSNNIALSQSKVGSLLDNALPNNPFVTKPFTTISVNPERTLLEKICLLHEEFKKPEDKTRYERMSRHLYDIYMMSQKGILDKAINNEELFTSIIKHRFLYTRIDGVDYNTESPGNFSIIPPEKFLKLYETDYNNTMAKMIFSKEKPSFETILTEITQVNNKINSLEWKETLQFTPGKNNQNKPTQKKP